eukprot:7652852-Pyramimonas_sp.AAC.1
MLPIDRAARKSEAQWPLGAGVVACTFQRLAALVVEVTTGDQATCSEAAPDGKSANPSIPTANINDIDAEAKRGE